MSEEVVRERKAALLAGEKIKNEKKILWMSFVDPDSKKTDKNLGVIITEDLGLMHAINKTIRMGINPGGEVACSELTKWLWDDIDIEIVKDRLLNRMELEALGMIKPGGGANGRANC